MMANDGTRTYQNLALNLTHVHKFVTITKGLGNIPKMSVWLSERSACYLVKPEKKAAALHAQKAPF